MKFLVHLGLLVAVGAIFFPLNAEALTVSPVRLEITGDPGATVQGELFLFNEQESTKTFYSSFENFEPSGDSGTPYFIGAQDGLATWLQTDSQIILESGERLTVPFSITIPQNAEPGGYFAAIFWGSQPPSQDGGVSIGGKIGVLILLRVSGEIEESGGLLNFNGKDKQKFFNSLPVTFEYRLNNTGGDRVVPLGEIKIKNTFRFTSATLLANKNEGSVLPGSARKFSVVWENETPKSTEENTESGFFSTALNQLKDFHFGWYTANLSLVWGKTSQTAQAAYNFFVIPWQLLVLAAAILIFLWFTGRIFLKKYNRRIIEQALRNQQQ